ncbi:MAG: hypothetical protein LIP11_05370 [Clostridiales bacterium]|nr:hypothetical protein [Clostridiales bacterium]
MEAMSEGVFQVGILVSDIDECLKLFRDVLGMKVVFEARNQVQPAKGLTDSGHQVMNVLMLRGEQGVDLELHQYVEPKAKEVPPITESTHIPGFAFSYFRGPDNVMIELHQGICRMPGEERD